MMEKQIIDNAGAPPTRRKQSPRSQSRFWIFTGLFLFLIGWQIRSGRGTWFPLQFTPVSNSKVDGEEPTKPFSWPAIAPKSHLEYSPCYENGLQCARLELPMDYFNGSTNATISLAVIRKPALVPVTDSRYGGAVLLNPGGPGGSGVFFLRAGGEAISQVLDDAKAENGKFYDLISFDPRGVVNTKPSVNCFDDPMLEQSWIVRLTTEGVFSASDAAFGRIWSMGVASSRSCSVDLPEGEPDIKKFLSTASVARDMLEIVERHGEWREREAKRLLGLDKTCPHSSTAARDAQGEVLETLRYRPNEEKIQYWGFSYGTVLGNTFAAMFPDRIHRLVVDGVVDIEDYKKALWFDNLVDTEKEIELFYHHCARAGFPQCALANATGDTSSEDVRNRYTTILRSLWHNPLPVIGPSAEVITYSDIKALTFNALYHPIALFPLVAVIMAGIEQGRGELLAEILSVSHRFTCPREPAEGHSSDVASSTGDNDWDSPMSYFAMMAIACTDGDDQRGISKEAFGEHVKNLTAISPAMGEIWSTIRLSCIHWDLRPMYRFEGPWKGKTSHPILEVGNTADPVTPGRFAKKMAKGFEGAIALLQDSPGHCSIAVPSRCTQGYIRDYFQTGSLPPKDTVCGVDLLPFGPSPGEEMSTDDADVEQLRQSYETIAQALYASEGGFLPGHTSGRPALLGRLGDLRGSWAQSNLLKR